MFNDCCECQFIATDWHFYMLLALITIFISVGFCSSGHLFYLYGSLPTYTYMNQVIVLWYVLWNMKLVWDTFNAFPVHVLGEQACLSSEFTPSIDMRLVWDVYVPFIPVTHN